MQPAFSMKTYDLLHYAVNVFFGGGVYKISLALLKNGHLFFVHFRGAMPFLFDDYIREITYNKEYKERRSNSLLCEHQI